MKSPALRHPARLAGASLLRMQSDARLAELAVTGHEAAFDAIVDRYRTPLLRYCAGIVGPSRAEDAVQQALINAHDAMTRTDEVRHLKPWLYRIAHNAALNVLRAVRDEAPLDEATLGTARAREAGPDESYERSEQFRATLAALQALPERQRAALVLRELEGRSHEEIADALGVTKGSARQHLMRARVAMRSAVTAITPYPLVARLAELLSGGGGGAGWVDAAAGAGASATLMKLGAGVAATGALVGGAVGTQHVVRAGSTEAASVSRADERNRERRPAPVVREASAPAAVVPAALPKAGGARTEASGRSPAKRVVPGRKGPRKPRAAAPAPAAARPVAARTPAVAAGPAVESETSHRGHRGADDAHARGRSEEHGHRGHAGRQPGQDRARGRDKGKGHGDEAVPSTQGNGGGQDKGSASSPGNSGKHKGAENGKGNGKDDPRPATPTAAAPEPASKGDQGNKGAKTDDPGDTAATPTAPATPSSASPD